ncbi:hypothetical protein ACFQ1I_34640 [Kitasatospora arboriphila]
MVRLFDDDFAHHVYATLGNVASRSVSYLSAPAFAAALMGREVLGTLSVYRHVLLIAEVAVDDASGLASRDLRGIEQPGGVRVLAVRLARRPADLQWNFADRAHRLAAATGSWSPPPAAAWPGSPRRCRPPYRRNRAVLNRAVPNRAVPNRAVRNRGRRARDVGAVRFSR